MSTDAPKGLCIRPRPDSPATAPYRLAAAVKRQPSGQHQAGGYLHGGQRTKYRMCVAMEKGLQFDYKPATSITPLPACGAVQRVDTIMLLPSETGQLMNDEVASQ